MSGVASNAEITGFTRRKFLTLAGLGGATLAGGKVLEGVIQWLGENAREAQAGVDWETDPYSKLDFVSHPEWLVDNPRLVGRIKGDMLDLSRVTDSLLKKGTEQGIDVTKWQDNATKLVDGVVRWGTNLVDTKRKNLQHAEYEVENKYLEQATYLRTILMIYEAHKNDTPEVLEEYLRAIPFTENNGSVAIQQDGVGNRPIEGVVRTDIQTVWSYDWKTIVNGQEAINTTIWHYFDWEGNVLEWIPNRGSAGYFPERRSSVIDREPAILGSPRPKEATIINFNPDVEKEVAALLHRVGIERGMRSVSWFRADFPQGHTSPEGDTSVGGAEGLDLEKYHTYQKVYDQAILHEGYHALAGRSDRLDDADRIIFRDFALGTATRFDPLSSMEKIFSPDGKYPNPNDYGEMMDFFVALQDNINYMGLTDYYFMMLDGYNANDNVKNYRDELWNGLMQLADVDIFKYLWPQQGDKSLEDVFLRLERSLPEMDSFSRFFAGVLLKSRDAIMAGKRHTFQKEQSKFIYFTERVIPLALAHVALYRKDELMASLPEGKNAKLVRHFIQSWQKRVGRFVRGQPNEELTADIFSNMLLDTEGKIDWGDTKENFYKMLAILKRNKLAFRPPQEVV